MRSRRIVPLTYIAGCQLVRGNTPVRFYDCHDPGPFVAIRYHWGPIPFKPVPGPWKPSPN